MEKEDVFYNWGGVILKW